MTHGAIETGKKNLQFGGRAYRGYDIKDFINKYRKSKK
jgi:hypothetical protein